jgi:hypothetical protein
MEPTYDDLAETFRNVFKSDTGVNPRGWSREDMQAYLDRRDAAVAANLAAGRDALAGIGTDEEETCEECGAYVDECECHYEHDGQPDEAQEWHDFDPDC